MKKSKVLKEFDSFVDYCRKLPRARAHILDPKRYAEMEKCYQEMMKVAQDNYGRLSYEIHPEDGYGCIRMESDDLVWYSHQGLPCTLIFADNLEIYPLKNGKIRTALMFYGITKTLKVEK